jgi:hypothetical protein
MADGEASTPRWLLDDLGSLLDCDLQPSDLLARHDGALSLFVGSLVVADRTSRSLVATYLGRIAESAPSGNLEIKEPKEALAGTAQLSIPQLVLEGRTILDGIQMEVTEPDDGVALEHLQALAHSAAECVGGLGDVMVVVPRGASEPGRLESRPGWIARLHVLNRIGETEAAADDQMEHILGLHAAVAAVYVPGVPKDSIWRQMQTRVTDRALALLEQQGGRVSGSEAEDPSLYDLDLQVEISADVSSVTPVHLLRLPCRRHGTAIQRGVRLVAVPSAENAEGPRRSLD